MALLRDCAARARATAQCPKATTACHYFGLLAALAVAMLASSPIRAQGTVSITIVNMVPQFLSGESGTDTEPSLAVNPSNTQNIAASAFTPDPLGGANAPIYISTDGGQSWALNSIVPGGNSANGTNDITLRFGTTSNVLYAATLRGDVATHPATGGQLNILRTNNFTSANPMTVLVSRYAVDQPYLEAISVAGTDRIYVGNNDSAAAGGRTATVDRSLDAATAPASAGFATQRIEARSTCLRMAPQSAQPFMRTARFMPRSFAGPCVLTFPE
jgi:hypothetical protein